MKNIRRESLKFFNAQVGGDERSWADAAAAYYRSIGKSTKSNFVDAISEYYRKVNDGTIKAPVTLDPTQAVVTGGASVSVTGNAVSTNAVLNVSSAGVVTIALPATSALVNDKLAANNITVTGTFTNTATFAVSGGRITGITLS